MGLDLEKGYSDEENEEEVGETEPVHGCIRRILLGLLSSMSMASILYFLIEFVVSPIHYIALLAFKCCICTYCCPEFIHRFVRNVGLTPCRWARISATGVGHIECWTHPAWPFRNWYNRKS
jgi:hypothetical protein